MFRIAHISDVHLGPLPPIKFYELAGKRLTGYLNWKLNRRSNLTNVYLDALINDLKSKPIDHIAITGDLINLSLPQEYKMAKTFLEQLGSPVNVTANCGKHDAYVPFAIQKSINH